MDQASIEPLRFRVTAIRYSIPSAHKQKVEANSSQAEEEKLLPPEQASAWAQLGIHLYEKYGGTQKFRLPQVLAQGIPISIKDIYEILDFFENTEIDRRGSGWDNKNNPSIDWIHWLLMGGDNAWMWARLVKRIRTAKIEIP
jgi:hypothetical protein